MCSWEIRIILLKFYFCVQYKLSCKSCRYHGLHFLYVLTFVKTKKRYRRPNIINRDWQYQVIFRNLSHLFLVFSWIEMIRAKWVRRWWKSGVIAVVSGINHNRLCNKPQSHIFVFWKIKKTFFTFAFLGGVHIEVFIYIHRVRENLWWENTNRTFWMSSKNNWYYAQFKTSFKCQRSFTLFHVFFMHNKLFYYVWSFKNRSSTTITLYHII